MVIQLFGHERHAAHETESGVEILELEAALNGVAAWNFAPCRKVLERRRTRTHIEFLDHDRSLRLCLCYDDESARTTQGTAVYTSDISPPTLADIDEMARAALASLPEPMLGMTKGVVLQV